MTRKPADLGVPEHARTEWDALHDVLSGAWTDTPCLGPGRAAWLGTVAEQADAADRCLDCPAMQECAAYALAAGERDGTWGGMTARERAEHRGAPTVRPLRTRGTIPPETVALIHQWASEGMKARRITDRLQEEEVPTASGGVWSVSSVRRVLDRASPGTGDA